MFGHEICLKGRLDTFSRFSAFKIHNSVSLWVKITRKPNGIGRPSWCFARKQSSNSATGCDFINRWIIGTRNKYRATGPHRALLESWDPPAADLLRSTHFYSPSRLPLRAHFHRQRDVWVRGRVVSASKQVPSIVGLNYFVFFLVFRHRFVKKFLCWVTWTLLIILMRESLRLVEF